MHSHSELRGKAEHIPSVVPNSCSVGSPRATKTVLGTTQQINPTLELPIFKYMNFRRNQTTERQSFFRRHEQPFLCRPCSAPSPVASRLLANSSYLFSSLRSYCRIVFSKNRWSFQVWEDTTMMPQSWFLKKPSRQVYPFVFSSSHFIQHEHEIRMTLEDFFGCFRNVCLAVVRCTERTRKP